MKTMALAVNRRVRAERLPGVFRFLRQRLGVEAQLEIIHSPKANAWTNGLTVWVTTSALEQLNEAQVVAVLGHELAHIKLNHLRSTPRQLRTLRRRLYQHVPSGFAGTLASAVIETGLTVASAERSRNFESQADKLGQAAASTLGCPHDSMGGAVETIAADHKTTRLLDKHPSTPARVANLNSGTGPRLRIRIVRRKN